MAKLGTEKRPIICRVHSDERAQYVAEICAEHGWHYIIGFERDQPEDLSDLERMLNPIKPVHTDKVGRNDPCPCGSGKKYKKCCVASSTLVA
ncbi:MAG: SEC-C domain-containing protein [Thiocapsa sp.]|uniref:PBPRA1643 family SWIM/SEC-C metal-binding motif protein n=1 Tax=Thiocapsa sp. TaxID=2024551 RepID=UPI001BD1477F|nr:PBPRA1643 family SWIM/SEC-C metal-binding motif protein [Thiocapsa sp.]QVL47005.1 MAG: SEC-C domain-containing protein [Thiocapsa sp.]